MAPMNKTNKEMREQTHLNMEVLELVLPFLRTRGRPGGLIGSSDTACADFAAAKMMVVVCDSSAHHLGSIPPGKNPKQQRKRERERERESQGDGENVSTGQADQHALNNWKKNCGDARPPPPPAAARASSRGTWDG